MRWLGDDTPMGWTLTLAYAVGAVLTLRAGLGVSSPAAVRRFVLASGAALVALGINKQLDLQQLVFVAGRSATFALGLYEQRDTLHIAFPLLVAAVLAVLGLLVARGLGAHLRAVAPMLAGFGLLALFIVVRVALFSHLVRVLGWAWLESDASALLELGAIVVITLGALRIRARSVPRTPARRS